MTDHGRRPKRWANDLNTILAAALGDDRFPIPVETLAKDFSKQRFPASPIVEVMARPLGSFEGALYPVQDKTAWAILHNTDVSPGRRRFTVAHEFGHYLMHRDLLPDGIACNEEAITFRAGEELEEEADTFAAYLLMPLDDFREQLEADKKPSLAEFDAVKDRYGVSLIACILRWLEYTACRSMLVVSRDGYVLWAKSSKAALRSRLYIQTRGVPPVPVPAQSLAGRRDFDDLGREGVEHPAGAWFQEPCLEITVISDKYDQTISILHFDGRPTFEFEDVAEEDAFDRLSPKTRERFE